MGKAGGQIAERQLGGYLVVSLHLILGLLIVVLCERPGQPAFVLAGLLLLNGAYLFFLKLKQELKTYWSPAKLWHFLPAMFAGLAIALLPALLCMAAGRGSPEEFSMAAVTPRTLLLTFFIVTWEELWFRGIYLNYCNRSIRAVQLSVFIGALFMLIHFLNPAIDLLVRGPALFFAGALLTLLYFYYRSFWVPLGLHFGNNLASSLLKTTCKTDAFFGEDGYLPALLLGGLFVFYALRMRAKPAV